MPSDNILSRSISIQFLSHEWKYINGVKSALKASHLEWVVHRIARKSLSRYKSPKNDSLELMFEKIAPGAFTKFYFPDNSKLEWYFIDGQGKDNFAGSSLFVIMLYKLHVSFNARIRAAIIGIPSVYSYSKRKSEITLLRLNAGKIPWMSKILVSIFVTHANVYTYEIQIEKNLYRLQLGTIYY